MTFTRRRLARRAWARARSASFPPPPHPCMLPAPAATQPASPEAAGTSSGGHCFVPPRCRAARVRFDLRPTESPVANYATFVLECRTRTQSKSGFSRCGSRSPLGDVRARCGALMGVSGARASLRFSRSVSFCICPSRGRSQRWRARARGAAAEWEVGRAAARRAPAERAREGAQAREGARERAYLSVRLVLSCARARERVCVGARGCVPVRAPARSGGGGEGCSLPACTGDGSSSAGPTDTAANAHASSTAPELT